MLQALLADRFQLVVKPDTRPMAAYVLSVGKDQPKLKAAENSSTSGCQRLSPTIKDIPYVNIQCRNVTLDIFASALRRVDAADFSNLPVVNSNGLEGAWDIDIEYPIPLAAPANNAPPPTATDRTGTIDAIEKQLGLKLEMGTAPQPVLAVESVNQQPSPQSAGRRRKLACSPLARIRGGVDSSVR